MGKKHSNSQILSRQRGYIRNYQQYPYGAYEENDKIFFGAQNTNTRLLLKAPGFRFGFNRETKFYEEKFFNPGERA